MSHRTIAAISTPLGPGGIGVIRISGPDAVPLLSKIFIPAGKTYHRQTLPRERFKSHHIYYGHIIDPGKQQIIDEAIVFFMKSPKSFTREDVVEIQSHSGFIVLEQILSTIHELGIFPAEPGEFSKRAFLNGRIDLGQAEAVIEKINASSAIGSQIASQQLSGRLKQKIQDIIEQCIDMRSRCEAEIEFYDDDAKETRISIESIKSVFRSAIFPEIEVLIQQYENTKIFKKGINITITGIPNVGKSSLLNQMTSRETAIVSEYPGTTRDIIQDYISLYGIPVSICDTAGIHATDNPIEQLGIEKAKKQIDSAAMLLVVVEGCRVLYDEELKRINEATGDNIIVVINKIDISSEKQIEETEKILEKIPNVAVSAKTGHGIEKLKHVIFKGLMVKDIDMQEDLLIPNVRQKKLLSDVKTQIREIVSDSNYEMTIDLLSDKIEFIIDKLSHVCGNSQSPDVYDEIFNKFCIGK